VGNIPRSAKKWARSAHLHEVKHDNVVEKTSRFEDGRLPSPMATNDIFLGTNLKVNDGKKSGSRRPSPLRSLPSPSPTPTSTTGRAYSAESEIDAWVDTDDTSSDVSLSPSQ
jgi:hypothetical protein